MSSNNFKEHYGPVALITGASSGIGRSFAILLASKGLDLVVVARRSQRLVELAASLKMTYHVAVHVHDIDLSQVTAAADLLKATTSLDVGLVVSNAGFGLKGSFDGGDEDTLAGMVMVNCNTPMMLARGFAPRLRARGKGGLIFTSSVEGLMGMPYSAVYGATKAFINSLGEALWGELTPEGVDILTLCPGATDTEAPGSQGVDSATLSHLMSPDDVARLALENIRNGPVYIPSAHYRATFETLLAMPRRAALAAIASNLKKG